MKKTNALALRQNMGKIVKELLRTGEPILLEKGRSPVAVLITVEDFQKRFVDVQADDRRKEIVSRILASELLLPRGKSSLDIIRESRS